MCRFAQAGNACTVLLLRRDQRAHNLRVHTKPTYTKTIYSNVHTVLDSHKTNALGGRISLLHYLFYDKFPIISLPQWEVFSCQILTIKAQASTSDILAILGPRPCFKRLRHECVAFRDGPCASLQQQQRIRHEL